MANKSKLALSILAVLALAAAGVARADPPAVKRTVIQKQDLRAQGQEGVMAQVELPPGAREGRHVHPAELFGYVIEGTLTLEVEGQPTATLKPGSSFFIGPGKVHEGMNKTDAPARVVAVFVTEKGKPMTSPAP
jgi:quercetin dioxygenase-like cupin family protein